MKIGDLVELSSRVTRKGRDHENQFGLVVEIKAFAREDSTVLHATVNFCGVLYTYPVKSLKVISES